MGLFDNSSSSSDEVRIGISEEESDSKLKEDVETRITDRKTDDGPSFGKSSGDVTVEDIHEQNQRIIELLEEIADEEESGSERSSRRNNNSGDDQGMRGGMDELL